MYKTIIFWIKFPLFHISPLIKSLASTDVDVVVICENDIPQWRLDMGFPYPDFGKAKVFVEPTNIERNKAVARYSNADAVHIFHGLRDTRGNFKSFKSLVKKDSTVGLYFEPLRLDGTLKSRFRSLYYKFLFYKYNKEISFMLALGNFGRSQFVELGISNEKAISFKYFVDNGYIASLDEVLKVDSPSVKILYIGQMVNRKNVLMLLESYREISEVYDNVSLTMVGDGNLRESLYKYAGSFLSKVTFLDYSSNKKLKKIFSEHDVLVLPSKFDGWGVVAVEAIARGLPVVVSDKCGSASIVKKKVHGIVFNSISKQALTEALCDIVKNREMYFCSWSIAERLQYAAEHLSVEAGKNELLKILDQIYLKNKID